VTKASRRLGEMGERLAADHLESRGYRIRERNFRRREGEIDIIAEKDGCVAFVEVKTRRGAAMGEAAESVTPEKGARLLLLAEVYAQLHADLPPDRRIDVVAVDLSPGGRLLRIQHIENAFSADELPVREP
jgi:putative endonuclease